jgi:hypothetical protein
VACFERIDEASMTDAESALVLKRLIAQVGTPQLLRLVADAAKQHAEDLVRDGADAARFLREATILAKASDAISD